MEIIDREPKIREGIPQRVDSNKDICSVSKKFTTILYEIFEELKKNNDIKVAMSNIRERDLAKRRVLKKEENGGFALITSVTVLGTIGIGTLIFMAVKSILAG